MSTRRQRRESCHPLPQRASCRGAETACVARLCGRRRDAQIIGELEDPRNAGLPPTTRCCGAGGIVRPTACACARQRQGASLRSAPAGAGLTALTPVPRTLVQTGSCPTMPNSDPYMLWSTTCSESVTSRCSLTHRCPAQLPRDVPSRRASLQVGGAAWLLGLLSGSPGLRRRARCLPARSPCAVGRGRYPGGPSPGRAKAVWSGT